MITVPLAATAVVYVLWFFLPGRRALTDLCADTALKQEFAAQAASLTASLERAEHELAKTRSYATDCQRHFVHEKELPAAFGRIHSLAETAGTRITRFEPQPTVEYEKFRCVPVMVGCQGSFAQIHAFLGKLDAMNLQTWVTSVRIEGAGDHVAGEVVLEIFADNPKSSNYERQTERPI